jgi:diguanylate cyclase (GGDEF)-like protein
MSKEVKHQAIRLKRTLLAIVAGAGHTFVCSYLWSNGLFRTTLKEFIMLFTVFWVIHILFPLLIITGINKKFKEASLSFMQIAWAEVCVMISLYFVNELRPLILMFALLGIIFGYLQLNVKQFIYIPFLTVVMYVMVTYRLYYYHPQDIVLSHEFVIIFTFTFIALNISAVALELNATWDYLRQKRLELESSLDVVQSDVITDELTGIRNRRYILNILEHQRNMVERQQSYYFSIALFDIDHFKKINDTYGHAAGDLVLQFFSKQIMSLLRKTDYFARMGGEEFLLVVPFANFEQIQPQIERIRAAVAETNFDHIHPQLTMTVSAGVTDYRWPEKIEEMIKRADKALYLAKENGRNQIGAL